MRSGLFFIGLWVLVAGGCATGPERPGQPGKKLPIELGAEREAQIAQVDHWKITGRIGIRNGGEGFSAGLEWLQTGKKFDIRLFDPLGRKVAWLRGDDQSVSLQTSDGRDLTAKDPQSLMQRNLGWSFPIRSFFYWVKGIPDPAKVVWRQEYDKKGHLVLMHQGGWKAKFSRYQPIDTGEIPQLSRLTRDDLRVKLLIREWE
ncbi:MAG TPA: outer membrane lipoprotein LolB [Gammaproteobacteria bacterium]|nr:outer membrane lipoprotein LolB [Gammaproteobacteria bacterium]